MHNKSGKIQKCVFDCVNQKYDYKGNKVYEYNKYNIQNRLG